MLLRAYVVVFMLAFISLHCSAENVDNDDSLSKTGDDDVHQPGDQAELEDMLDEQSVSQPRLNNLSVKDLEDLDWAIIDALTQQERAAILQQLVSLSNSSEVEQLPQPAPLIGQVRHYWQQQQDEQRRIRYKIRQMILNEKPTRASVARGPPVQGVRGPQPHAGRPASSQRRQDRPRPRPQRPQRVQQDEEVIGHQFAPINIRSKSAQLPMEHRKIDSIQDILASGPAPKPYLFKVPGEGVIKLPPPPSFSADQRQSSLFPPPFAVGSVPGGVKHGQQGSRRRLSATGIKHSLRRPPVKKVRSRRPQKTRKPARPHRPPAPHGQGTADNTGEEYRLIVIDDESDVGPSFMQPPPIVETIRFDHDTDSAHSHPFDFSPDLFGISNFERLIPNKESVDHVSINDARSPHKTSSAGGALRPGAREECDFFTESICLESAMYPYELIGESLSLDGAASRVMLAEVRQQSADNLVDGVSSQQEDNYDYKHYFGANRRSDGAQANLDAHSHRDFAQEGGYLCPSEVKYARPMRARNSNGQWKFVVNMHKYTQTLRMEKCMRPGGSCSYVSHHYRSQCSQVYNYHRLLSWDSGRGLHMDIFKVPVACSCHIQGYSYVYPPLDTSVNNVASIAASNIHENSVENKDSYLSSNVEESHRNRRIETYAAPPRELTDGGASVSASAPAETPARTETATTKARTTSTSAPRTTPRPTNHRRRYRTRLQNRLTRRPSVTSPPYRRRQTVTSDLSSRISELDQSEVEYGERVTNADGYNAIEMAAILDTAQSGSDHAPEVYVQPPSLVSPPPPPLSSLPAADTDNSEQKVNYGYHPIIDFFDAH